VAIAPAEGLTVNLTTTKTKKRNQPAKARHNSLLKKDFRKMAKTVVNQVLLLLSDILPDMPRGMRSHIVIFFFLFSQHVNLILFFDCRSPPTVTGLI